MKRLIVPIAIVAAVALTATGCSSSKKASGGSSSPAASGGSSSSAALGSPITIGFPVPLTSGNSVAAGQMVTAAKLAVADINASGGAGGHELVLKTYDDLGTPDGATQVVQRAITVDGAKIIIGAYSSAESLAVRTVAERQKLVYMATSSVGPQVTDSATYTFRTTINQKDYAPPMARTMKALNVTKPVILADTGPVGSTLPPGVVTALSDQGITAGTTVSYTLNSTNVSASVAKVVAQKPDAVIIIGSASADQGLIVKTLGEQGLTVPIMGFGSLVAGNALTIGGAAYGKMAGVYTVANISPGKPAFDKLVTAFASATNGDAAALSSTIAEQVPDTYDGFMIIRAALNATKGDTDGATLAKALHALPPYTSPAAGKVGATISFANTQDGFHDSLSVFKVTDGKAVLAPGMN